VLAWINLPVRALHTIIEVMSKLNISLSSFLDLQATENENMLGSGLGWSEYFYKFI
jgi:hypothetical protein